MADHKLSFLISNVQIPSCPSKVEKSETHCTNTHKERMPEHPFSLSCLSPAFIPLKKHWGVNCKCREPEDNYPQHTRLSISPLLWFWFNSEEADTIQSHPAFAKTESRKYTKGLWNNKSHTIPPLLLLLLPLELFQVSLGQLDDIIGLLLRGEECGGEGAGAAVQRGARGGPGQAFPEILTHSLTFEKFSSEERVINKYC